MEDICQLIIREFKVRRDEIAEPFTTIYIGGGTPSILPPATLSHLVAEILDYIPRPHEFTIEINPEDATKEYLTLLRQIGINRISMGVQSLVDKELKAVGRRHSAQQAIEAARMIREAGFDNVSMDLIYGLPGQTVETWNYSLETLMSLHPSHFSAYSLSIEPGTRLHSLISAGKISLPSEETSTEMYSILCQAAKVHGFRHYEISNFALPHMESRHNSSYWTGTPYLGLGPSAVSYDGVWTRRTNTDNARDYIKDFNHGVEIEEETPTDLLNDMIFTGLRTYGGINLPGLRSRFGDAQVEKILAYASPFIADNSLILTSDTLRIPEDMWLRSDMIIRELMIV